MMVEVKKKLPRMHVAGGSWILERRVSGGEIIRVQIRDRWYSSELVVGASEDRLITVRRCLKRERNYPALCEITRRLKPHFLLIHYISDRIIKEDSEDYKKYQEQLQEAGLKT